MEIREIGERVKFSGICDGSGCIGDGELHGGGIKMARRYHVVDDDIEHKVHASRVERVAKVLQVIDCAKVWIELGQILGPIAGPRSVNTDSKR